MCTQSISFPDRQSLCVFPVQRSDLEQAISGLHLNDGFPVIVLIGGVIDEHQVKRYPFPWVGIAPKEVVADPAACVIHRRF